MRSETINWELIKLPDLKTKAEIKNYLQVQMVKFFPNPKDLFFDYIVSGKGEGKVALICFSYKWNSNNNLNFNPLLLIQHLIKSDDLYTIITENIKFKFRVESSLIKSFKSDFTKAEGVVITSDKFINEFSINEDITQIVDINNYGKHFKSELFKEKPKSKSTALIYIVVLLVASLLISVKQYKNSVLNNDYISLKNKEAEIRKLENLYQENYLRYKNKKNDLLELESKIPPNLLTILSSLNKTDIDFIINSLTYSNRNITMDVTTQNGYELVNRLNKTGVFLLKLNNSTPSKDGERVNISGEVK